MRSKVYAAVAVLLLGASAAMAGMWTEVGDAGQAGISAAQVTYGFGSLSTIHGYMAAGTDADVFKIYISDPAMFSATTLVGNPLAYDTQLFLFDSTGKGVYANDDISNPSPYIPASLLPAGSPYGPQTAGYYYVGVTTWDNDPYAVTPGGDIFNDDLVYVGVATPVGVNAGSPYTNFDGWWVYNSSTPDPPWWYDITLTGAEFAAVPAPAAVVLGAIGLGLVGWVKRRLS